MMALLTVMGTSMLMATTADKPKAKKVRKAEYALVNTILTRSSVRTYTDDAVEKEKITLLLKAGMAAPSAVDRRPWHFVVVTDKAQLAALAKANPNASFAEVAPLAIVVCGDMNKALKGGGREFWVQDCSAATENILIAAHALGLGAVWTGNYPNTQRSEAVARVLSLPAHLVPLNTIVIGYPRGDIKVKDKYTEDNVSYNTYQGKDE